MSAKNIGVASRLANLLNISLLAPSGALWLTPPWDHSTPSIQLIAPRCYIHLIWPFFSQKNLYIDCFWWYDIVIWYCLKAILLWILDLDLILTLQYQCIEWSISDFTSLRACIFLGVNESLIEWVDISRLDWCDLSEWWYLLKTLPMFLWEVSKKLSSQKKLSSEKSYLMRKSYQVRKSYPVWTKLSCEKTNVI